jgi:hypothetical protein
VFSSIEEAKNIFEYGRSLFFSIDVAQLLRDPTDLPAIIEAQISHVTTLLSKFSLALQTFIESQSASFTPKEEIAIAVLQLHLLDTHVTFHVEHLPPSYRSSWDEFIPQMNEMLALSEKIVSHTSSGNGYAGQATSFCLDLGYIIPLHTVASRCQDPAIRRKAIELLRATPRQEGLWNSLLIAKADERMMEIEESMAWGMDDPVDGWDQAKSLNVRPFLHLDRSGGRLQYVRQGKGAHDQINVVEEVFTW